MNIDKKSLYALLVLLLGLGIYFGIPLFKDNKSNITNPSVTTFEECVKINGQITLQYPGLCNYNGKSFTQQIEETANLDNYIQVTYPMPGDVIKSPLEIKGKAVGGWYFEGDFPITLYDDQNNVIATGYGTAQTDWMVEDFVNFTATLEFTPSLSNSDRGQLVLQKNNPSGLPENDIELIIPVQFNNF